MDRQADSIDLVQSFNYLHASAFCAPSLRRLFQNLDDSFDFQPTCETISIVKNERVFLLSHLFAFHTLRIVYSMENRR